MGEELPSSCPGLLGIGTVFASILIGIDKGTVQSAQPAADKRAERVSATSVIER